MSDETIDNNIITSFTDWPLPSINPLFPFPLDIRHFFSRKEDAYAAAEKAVSIDVLRDYDTMPTEIVIPSEENGGMDYPYYFGEEIVVINEDRTEATLYVIVKDENTSLGTLFEIGSRAFDEINRLKSGTTSVFEITTFDNRGAVVGDYYLIGEELEGLTFHIISKYDEIDGISITLNNTQTVTYTKDNEGNYVWPNTLTETSRFEIVISFGGARKTFEKNIQFVLPSKFGVISDAVYESISEVLSIYQDEGIFNHVYDINGLDYIDCYKIFYGNALETCNIIIPNWESEIARGYYDSFDTQAFGLLDVDERFYILVFKPDFGYLLYVKDDPCQINNLKQKFEL